ncbi:hypothetical protein [Gloeothece verrucosa]|uniref:Uncharacterized protein n=1 Tax=Gloeothece verrucosa (strain PCC 7822) TaxID=497965 RepID=E0UEP6_GLOV7|nr:hypothetical protein [Gloeothece verrucosa]ADN16614.1 hypothetical protein Cyan7822_4710 [Gloeothece verrucosa PCC 7822]
MKESLDPWSQVTNQWLKIWAASSTAAWKNWLVLTGFNSTDTDNHCEHSPELLTDNIEDLIRKLVEKTEKSENREDWQRLEALWVKLANILLNSNSEEAPQKISEIAHQLENFSLHQKPASNAEENIKNSQTHNLPNHPIELSKQETAVRSYELLPQVQLVGVRNEFRTEKPLSSKEDKLDVNHFLEQENKKQSQIIEQLKARIDELENHLEQSQSGLSKKEIDEDSSELKPVKLLEEQLSAQEYQITQLNHQITATQAQLAEKAKNLWSLEQENEQKSQTIEQLQIKIAQLETVAEIGNKQLNKWRFRTFSN